MTPRAEWRRRTRLVLAAVVLVMAPARGAWAQAGTQAPTAVTITAEVARYVDVVDPSPATVNLTGYLPGGVAAPGQHADGGVTVRREVRFNTRARVSVPDLLPGQYTRLVRAAGGSFPAHVGCYVSADPAAGLHAATGVPCTGWELGPEGAGSTSSRWIILSFFFEGTATAGKPSGLYEGQVFLQVDAL